MNLNLTDALNFGGIVLPSGGSCLRFAHSAGTSGLIVGVASSWKAQERRPVLPLAGEGVITSLSSSNKN